MALSKKTKKYILMTVTKHDGTKCNNELLLSESRFIVKAMQEHKSVECSIIETTESDYKSLFGIYG